ncbi:MAG: hypothetical protein RBU37_18435 [Myxococcota bacterium]|jgi:hypothetical protein|nr:hypothetical protein [Myxococcota bacterium]
MSLMIVLNDLSHRAPAPDRHEGKRRLRVLVEVLRAVARQRRDASLLSQVKLKGIELAPGYSVGQWSAEPDSKELWLRLRALQNVAPFELAEPGSTLAVDYYFEDLPSAGLGWAHRLDGLAASFELAPFDSLSLVPLKRELYVEDEGNELRLESTEVVVPHVAKLEHLQGLQLAERGRRRPITGAAMWEHRAELFSRLSFLPGVERQLRELLSGDPRLDAIFERLSELEHALSCWEPATRSEPAWESKVTPEHEQRKKLCWYKDLDGVSRCFDLHARFTPGCGRIHFRLEPSACTAIVAHVGEKLGSAR